MKKVLIISFSPIQRDPRVMRQIWLLESSYDLTVAGFGEKPDARVNFIEIARPSKSSVQRKIGWVIKLLTGAFESYYWGQHAIASAFHLLRDTSPDVIIANDLSALPLALKLANGKPVIFDAHEYSPREIDDQFLWRLLFKRYTHTLCRRYLPQATSMLTVCQGIADEYARCYGVKSLVVRNAPFNQRLSPSPVREGVIRMIHHGMAGQTRRLELSIEMMAYLDERFTLDLMLVETEPGYMAFLRKKAQHDARIRFLEPVPMPQISQRINEYDVGLFLQPPVNFSDQYALPNKFFEFIQACLMVAIGPSPEMAKLVREYECGIISDSFEPQALARALSELDAGRVRAFKEASHRAAQSLCFEQDGRIIEAEVERLA